HRSHVTIIALYFSHAPTTTQISTLSLHDALPISRAAVRCAVPTPRWSRRDGPRYPGGAGLPRAPPRSPARSSRAAPARASDATRSEEHTSELQSRFDLVCRLLLEKKNKMKVAPLN